MDIPALLDRLGGIGVERLVMPPAPGTATSEDVVRFDKPALELIEGTLVRRPDDHFNACAWTLLMCEMFGYVRKERLGLVSTPVAPLEILPGLVRAPDVAFTSWSRLPGRKIPVEPIAQVVPELVVNGFRIGNTLGELAQKRSEYFRAGVRLYWEFDARARTARVYTSIESYRDLLPSDAFDGGDVIPGFSMPIGNLWAELDRHG